MRRKLRVAEPGELPVYDPLAGVAVSIPAGLLQDVHDVLGVVGRSAGVRVRLELAKQAARVQEQVAQVMLRHVKRGGRV